MVSEWNKPDEPETPSTSESRADSPTLPLSKPSSDSEGLGELESLSGKTGSGASLAHFRLLKEVGRGGMGTVYRALDTLLDREVAVKVLSEELSAAPEFQERFVREAKIVARMADPNIPQIHFIGRAEGCLFFAMEWIDGRTLEGLIREEGLVPPEKALDIAAQAARALQVAHRAGITHRDIKPSNLMLTREGVVKVLDFGIARSVALQGDATMTAGFVGTPLYASPEQARGAPVDARSDIYSLGATLFELLTGQPPFVGDNPMAVLTDRLVRPAPPLPEAVGGSPGVRTLVSRMLATRPEDRFPNAGELLAAIRAAHPAPPVAARFSRRTMASLVDLLLALAPLVALFIGFWAVKGYFITTPLYDSVAGRIVLASCLFAWFVTYFAILGRRRGATFGMRFYGLSVLRRDQHRPSSVLLAARAAFCWGPVCLAMALQRDWPPVLRSLPGGQEESYLLSNLPWVIAQLWIVVIALTPILSRRRWSLADWLSKTEVVESRLRDAGQDPLPETARSWRIRFMAVLARPRFLLDATVIATWLAMVILVGMESRNATPWSWNPGATHRRHYMFERVELHDPGWERLRDRFLREFLRPGDEARNPEVVAFERHAFLPMLAGTSMDTLIIENGDYGARLRYGIDWVWALAGTHRYWGVIDILTQEIESASPEQAQRWDDARRKIYRGSRAHFLRALMHRRVHAEGFEVRNPEAFVGLFRVGNSFILVAWPRLDIRLPGGEEQKLILYSGWCRVYNAGEIGGSVGYWGFQSLPRTVLSRYAEEQDSLWGKPTESIEQVVTLE
ncbi:MAG: protein kinase [Acidobacteriota bacterium]